MMKYPRNLWYVAAWISEVAPQKPMRVEILNQQIVLYRGDSGRLVALEDRCVHRLAPLSLGRCEPGDNIRCMYHGIVFNPEGKVIKIPAQDQIPEKARVRTYPVVERHGWVWIWMGDADKVDEALIPAAHVYDDPDYTNAEGVMDFRSEAALFHDNLLDLSHVSFLHQPSFGDTGITSVDEANAERHSQMAEVENGAHFWNWGRSNLDKNLETCAHWYFVLPGVFILHSGDFPLGTADSVDQGVPDFSKCVGTRFLSTQAVTPTADGRSRYFYSFGAHREHGGEQLRDTIFKAQARAFRDEDGMMVEAQQRALDADPGAKFMPVANDRAVVMYNRLVARKLLEESPREQPEAVTV